MVLPILTPVFSSRLLLICYGLSGLTALAYEVLWARMLSLQFGVSAFGVVFTVTAFMLGLGLGSLLARRFIRDVIKPLFLFGCLELTVAVYALSLPLLLSPIEGFLAEFADSVGSWFLIQGVAVTLMLMLPATALGAAFPLVLKGASSTKLSLGTLYGVNTLGGASGALLPLILLPLFGWSDGVRLVAGLSFIVAALAFYLNRSFGQSRSAPSVSLQRPPIGFLLAYGGLGAAALMLQVGWTRLFGMLMLRTEYVLGILLAVFLLGIGLGSLFVKRSHSFCLTLFPIMAAGFGLGGLFLVPILSDWVMQGSYSSLGTALLGQGLAIALLTLPMTLLMGAWLPLLVFRLGSPVTSGAWLYGANSLGAGCGAILAGFVLIPTIGTQATVVIAVLTFFCLGMAWSDNKKFWLILPVLLVIGFLLHQLPQVHQLQPRLHANTEDIYQFEDAVSITHVIKQSNGQRLLLSDLQRMDASSDPMAVRVQKNQARLPLLLNRDATSVLFLGLGTGISASGALDKPGLQITAVELSKGAIEAAKSLFVRVNGRVSDSIEIVRDDARRFLKTENSKYDVIVGDVFHPDMVGRSNLLSVQQFERVKDHLSDGGIYAQWLALNQFDLFTLKIILRSFQQVFKHADLYLDGFRLVLVGRTGQLLNSAQNESWIKKLSGGENIWTWRGRYFGPITVEDGDVQDEWFPKVEFQLPRIRYRASGQLQEVVAWLLEQRPTREDSIRLLNINKENRKIFSRAFLSTELIVRSWLADLSGKSIESQRLVRMAYQANQNNYWVKSTLADKMFNTLDLAEKRGLTREQAIKKILDIDSEHIPSIREMRKLYQDVPDLNRYYSELLFKLSPYS